MYIVRMKKVELCAKTSVTVQNPIVIDTSASFNIASTDAGSAVAKFGKQLVLPLVKLIHI